MKKYSTFSKAPRLKPNHLKEAIVILRTLVWVMVFNFIHLDNITNFVQKSGSPWFETVGLSGIANLKLKPNF